MESVRILDFFNGRSILMTGGTGFMGKVMMEKLLYCVPDIGNIYVVLRPKRGKSIQQRLSDITKLPIYDRLRKSNPSALNKLIPIQGDVLFNDLGISSADIEVINNEVSIVYHFAATLKLEAPLKDNVDMNTSGTLRVLKIAREIKNLCLFLHLSTAFCYPDYEYLGENTHPPAVNPHDMIRLCQWLDDKQLAILTTSLLGMHPNCYTYSKRLAEALIEEAYADLPVVIARPSIVIPSLDEPVPGWVDSLNGPVGVMVGAGKGVIRSMLCNADLVAQVIPVDVAIKALICISSIEGKKKEKSKLIPVYNLNVSNQKKITWGETLNKAKTIGRKQPLSWPLWYPNGDLTTNHVKHYLKCFFFHWIPAYFIEFLLLILGQKRFMLRVAQKVSQGLEVLQYFTMRNWMFESAKYEALEDKLKTKEEKEALSMDISERDIDEYFSDCVDGGRIYCLKEDPTKIPLNRIHHNVLFILDFLVKVLFWLFILSVVVSWIPPLKSVFALGGSLVRHLPFLGSTVFSDEL